MKKDFIAPGPAACFQHFSLRADEGMWLVNMLNRITMAEMRRHGTQPFSGRNL